MPDGGFGDGGESMWEDTGEEEDGDMADDFAADIVDEKDSGDREVKELMSEIMGTGEADEVLGLVGCRFDKERIRAYYDIIPS